ncbi:MAG TPA: hypothetical protein VGB77_22765 [Abditibacteriaceae bacterium]
MLAFYGVGLLVRELHKFSDPFVVAVGIAISLWAFLSSGHYWLTTKRLIWKPRIGQLQQVALDSIDKEDIHVKPVTSSIVLQGKAPPGRITMSHISGLNRLWGALLLFSSMDSDALEPDKELGDVVIWKAMRVEGLVIQSGIAVLRPDYLAFLPVENANDPGEVLKDSVTKAIIASAFITFEAEAKYPVDLLIQVLREKAPEQFDSSIGELAQGRGGFIWRPHETQVRRRSIPLRRRHLALWFDNGPVSVRGALDPAQINSAQLLLSSWNLIHN